MQNHEIQVSVKKDTLKIAVKEQTLNDIFMILQSEGIIVLDIEKRVTGSEERYQQIFDGME